MTDETSAQIKANTPDALTRRAPLKSGGENFNEPTCRHRWEWPARVTVKCERCGELRDVNPRQRPTSTLADLDRWERQEQGWLRYWFWRVVATVRGWVGG